SGRYYYHTDALGSTAALSDSTGTLKESYAYSPYGEITSPGTLGNPYLFTGRQLDRESGLYYYRARHYDPASGRFIQPDPIGFDGGINLYAYVLNNPLMFVDPDGEFPVYGAVVATVVILHYTRNIFNDEILYIDARKTWEKLHPDKAIYHRMGKGNENNEKYISSSGHSEAIFTPDGKLVTDSANMGTFNFFPPNILWGIPHGIMDVIPYFVLGNTPGDMFNPDRFTTSWNHLFGSSK
ncbi:MAG: RHS repeat-associated core domain-containing protein, partial [Desulfobacula sp.]